MVHVSGDAPDEALEGGSRQKHVDRLLVLLDLAKGNGASLPWPPPLFDPAVGRGGLLDGFGGGHLLGVSSGFGCNFGLGHSGERKVVCFEIDYKIERNSAI